MCIQIIRNFITLEYWKMALQTKFFRYYQRHVFILSYIRNTIWNKFWYCHSILLTVLLFWFHLFVSRFILFRDFYTRSIQLILILLSWLYSKGKILRCLSKSIILKCWIHFLRGLHRLLLPSIFQYNSFFGNLSSIILHVAKPVEPSGLHKSHYAFASRVSLLFHYYFLLPIFHPLFWVHKFSPYHGK